MKKEKKLLTPAGIIALAALPLLASCVKDTLYNTPHPDTGAVVVTADFSGRSADSQLPGTYVLRIDDTEQSVSGTTNTFGTLMTPGTHTLLIYNHPDDITVSGTTATVNTLTDGTLHPTPASLFSGTQSLTVVADDTLRVTQAMAQRTRSLTFRLDLSEDDAQRLVSVSSTLSGVTSTVNLSTGEVNQSVSGTVIPVFELMEETDAETRASTSQWYLEATVILVGIVGSVPQNLTLTLTLDTGHEETISSDLSDTLSDFNNGSGTGKDALELDGDLELPIETVTSGSITNWTTVENEAFDIH